MDWEIVHRIEQADNRYDEQQDELTLQCTVLQAAEHFHKLLDGATQAALDFHGGELNGEPVIGFRLRNANGEFYLALPKGNWELLLEQPDEVLFIFGNGEKERFSAIFLNGMFERFLDEVIEKYNAGEKNPFTSAVVDVFAEEE